MGYKRAGMDVVGAVDIDPEMMEFYRANLHPARSLTDTVGAVLNQPELVDAWQGVDIVDGSPPCTSFSTLGTRDKTWGQDRYFREGQATQVLDQLFFDYLNVVDKLQPKVFIAENVAGMMKGKARGYVKKILDVGTSYGYDVQLFHLLARDYSVPQRRPRVFFVGRRRDLGWQPLSCPASTGTVTNRQALNGTQTDGQAVTRLGHHEWSAGGGKQYSQRETGAIRGFSHQVLKPDRVGDVTVASAGKYYHWAEPRHLSTSEMLRLGTFPDDYKVTSASKARYIVGMSVPPKMMEAVAGQVRRQWFDG